jgi:hypothetical protein
LLDNSGGLIVVNAASQAEAEAIKNADPAIQQAICIGHVHPWLPMINDYTGFVHPSLFAAS